MRGGVEKEDKVGRARIGIMFGGSKKVVGMLVKWVLLSSVGVEGRKGPTTLSQLHEDQDLTEIGERTVEGWVG